MKRLARFGAACLWLLGPCGGARAATVASSARSASRLGAVGLPSRVGFSASDSSLTLQPAGLLPILQVPLPEVLPGPDLGESPHGAAPAVVEAARLDQALAPVAIEETRPALALPEARSESAAAAPALGLLRERSSVSFEPGQAEALSPGELHGAGQRIIDRVLGLPGRPAAASAPLRAADEGFFGSSSEAGRVGPYQPAAAGADLRVPPPAEEPAPDAAPRRSLWSRLWAPFRIVSEPQRNREYWKFVLGQALMQIGVGFHYTALPGLVAPRPEDAPRVSLNRTVNWTAQGLASLTTGPLVDRSSTRAVLVWTNLGRSLLLLAVPILFFNGLYAFAAFQVIIFLAGFLQSVGMTGNAVAFARILGDDEKAYNRANAAYNLLIYAVGVLAPLLAGGFIGMMNARYGFLSGNALSYGLYGLLALAVALLYQLWLKLPRDEVMQARRGLAAALRKGPGKVPGVRGVAVEYAGERTFLVVEVSGEPALAAGVPAEHAGFPVKVVRARRPLAEMLEGFRLNWSDRFMRWTLLFSTFEVLAGEALIFGVLPRYIREVMLEPDAAWLASLPGVGPLLAGLATKAGAFGLYLAVSALGMGLSSVLALFLRSSVRPGDPSAGYWGRLDTLERQALASSVLYGLGSLALLGVFLTSSLWVSAAMMLVSALLQAPAQVVWASMHQRVLQERFADRMGVVLSARSFYFMLLSIAGLLLFGWAIGALSIGALWWLVGGAMAVVALAHIIEPLILFPLKRTGRGTGPSAS